ncbi:right-handed parallel beta-helix repeat-containing protein [Schleiferiaceae bacterium]|nr:right-handed parallel beta-helix repeat-containing protein [Schleiferiaceae bacterium]MDA9963835.1 right-handed parallel beta-helix repeat-containing protein [Schleiferiaceae bacterium]
MKKQLLTIALGLFASFGMSVQAQTYCSVSFSTGCTYGDYIDDVTIGTFSDMNTGCSTGNYYDGTSDTIEISLADPVAVSLTAGYSNQYYGIWIDLNDDGDFADTGEFVWSNSTASGTAGTATTGSFTVPSTFSTGTYRLRIVDHYGGSQMIASESCTGTSYGEYHDYTVKVNSAPACATPLNFSATTFTTSAGLNWDATTANYYVVEYDTTGFTIGTGDTMWVYTDTAYIAGLTSSTAYDFYVKGYCTGSTSNAASLTGVYTQCAAFATPYAQNFDNTLSGGSTNPSLPQCWEYYKSGTNTYSTYHYTYSSTWSPGNSGSGSLYMNSGSSSLDIGDTSASMTPVIQGLDSATKMMEFYGKAGSTSYDGEFFLAYANANGDASSMRIFDTIQLASTSWGAKNTVYLDDAQTGDARIAFVMICDGAYDYMYLDDVSFKDIPPCPEPISLTLNASQKTSATIGWTSSSSAFNIEIGPMGFTQGTGTAYTSSTTSYTATGLTQNTYYDVYVMSNCTSTGDGTSNWVGPFTFKTECGSFASPYSEDFGYSDGSGSSSNPDLPDCWEHQNLSPYQYNYAYVDKYYYYGNQATDSAYIYLNTYYSTYSSQTALGDTNMIVLPSIAGLGAGTQQIIFNARSISTSAAYISEIAVATIDSNLSLSSLSIVDTVEVMGISYADYSLDLDNVASDADHVVLIAFGMVNSGYTYGYNGAYFDKITIRDIPNCPIAKNFTGAATSDSSATLSWTDSSAVSSYVIEWGAQGFTQGTGAPTDTVIGNSWSTANLSAGVTYDFYILSDCMSSNGSLSPWVGPISIDVPCTPSSVPFADGFENKPNLYGNTTDPNLPDCWVYSSNGGSSYSYGSTSTWGSAYAGSGYLYNSQSNVLGDTVVVSLPMIEDLNQGGNELRFWARVSSTFYPGHMAVATTHASGSYTTTSVVQNLNVGSDIYQQYSVFLDSNVVNSNSMRPAFLFYSVNGAYNYIYLDSAEVLPMPACINYNQMASNVTDTSADLSWSYTGNNCFNVEYGPVGFIQGTGVGALSGTVDSNVTAAHSLAGLNPNTAYDFYIESCCNPGQWEGPFTFQTECTGPLAAGTYSVGPTGDFATMDSVISTLNVCGINGAVTFEFQSGAFTASEAIGDVSGASASNTITFKGSPTVNDTIGALVLEGAKYITLEDLYINSPNTTAIRLNGTSDITITGNTIEAGIGTSSTVNGIVASGNSTSIYSTTIGEKNLTVTNNHISGGYFGVRLYGSLSGLNENVTISNNTFDQVNYQGIYVFYGLDVTIEENMLDNFGASFAYGIYTDNIDGLQLLSNEVYGANYGVMSYYTSTNNASDTSLIANNMVKVGYTGLYVYYNTNTKMYHNTTVGNTYGFYMSSTSSSDIRNNIFEGGTYAAYLANNVGSNMDYNLYHSLGTSLASYNYSAKVDLAALQAADTTNNMNSVEGDPIFASSSDLHVYGPLANNTGDNNAGITSDIDGDSRPMSGSITVDIGADEFDVVGDDAALTALLSPGNGVCGGDSLMVSVEIGNFGQNALTALTVSADIMGTTLTQNLTSLSVPFGGRDTVMLGYVSNYVGGPMTVVAYAQLTGDGRPGNDTLTTSVLISDAQQVAVSYPTMICSGDDVVMDVTHPTMGTVLWSSNGDTIALAGVDSTITLTGVTMDTTITVGTVSSETEILTPIPSYTWSGIDGVYFTSMQAGTLDSVSIYPSTTTGSETVNVVDVSTGSTIFTTSVSWSGITSGAETQVAIGAPVGVGSYLLLRASSTSGSWKDMFVGSGTGGYPFYSTDSNFVLTSGTYASYIEYFFNWKFTVGGCDREDTTFTVGIYPDAVAAISVDTANATISATDWMANWSTSGTTGADSIYVEFSNGTSSNDTSGTVTFNANNAGETVTVIAFGPCSSDTATFTFDVNQISVDEDFLNGTLSIYPNPTRGLFNVEFATASATDVEISIVNMVGQVISTEVVTVNGLYNNQFDLSNESAGVYFIKFTTEDGVLTERITVE